MTQERYRKDHGPIDEMRERTGLYKLGFELPSFLGFSLPFLLVIGIGGVLGLIIWQWL